MADSETVPTHDDRGGANPISLAHVLALSVPVHWTESVAVVEELCLVLTAAGGDPIIVPDAQDVLITVQGTVIVRRGAPGTMDVEGIGRVLNALLDPVTTPIPLRLFVAHSIGSEKYRSVSAYGEALAYYARPDRQELIQALYRRCLESATTIAPIVDEPVPVEPPPPVPDLPLVPQRKIPRWAALVAVVLLMAIASYFASRRVAGAMPARPMQTLSAAAAGVVRSVQQLLTSSSPPSAEVPAPVELDPRASVRRPRAEHATVSSATARRVKQTASAPRDEPTDTPRTSQPVPVPPPQVLVTPPQVLMPLESGSVSEGALALPPVAVNAVERTFFNDPTIYTSASPDVQPPVMYSPKLPPMPPARPDMLGTNTMELLIDETGNVLKALLTSPPVRLSDMLLLSPAKTWKFHPALKDGRPVKYRLAVSWAVAPP
jgi:hypothetical protein